MWGILRAAVTALEIQAGIAFGPLRIGMTELQAMGAMEAIGVVGERKRERIWDLEADPPALTDEERAYVWFERCLRADFSLADGRLEFMELSDGSLVGVLDGIDVLAVDQLEAVELFRRVSDEEPRVEEDGDCVTFARTGAALWRGGDDERAPGRWEAVAVGAPGYFDR